MSELYPPGTNNTIVVLFLYGKLKEFRRRLIAS
jgi:hypothetical protein